MPTLPLSLSKGQKFSCIPVYAENRVAHKERRNPNFVPNKSEIPQHCLSPEDATTRIGVTSWGHRCDLHFPNSSRNSSFYEVHRSVSIAVEHQNGDKLHRPVTLWWCRAVARRGTRKGITKYVVPNHVLSTVLFGLT